MNREKKLFFKHRNFLNYGFISNNDILDQLKKVSISVICSRWQEPFGRASWKQQVEEVL